MLCRKKISPVRRKIRKIIAIFLTLTILLLTYFELAVKEQLREVMIRDILTLTEQAVTAAVEEYLSENPDMGERMCKVTCSGGAVSAVTTDPAAINAVKTAITEKAQANIDTLSREQGVSAHLGSLTGLVFLANAGPTLRFSVDSSQTVSCEFESSFESAGINQTVHHLTLTVYVDLLIYNPFRVGKTVSTSSTYEIAQTVIVGSVPSYSGVVTY